MVDGRDHELDVLPWTAGSSEVKSDTASMVGIAEILWYSAKLRIRRIVDSSSGGRASSRVYFISTSVLPSLGGLAESSGTP